MKRLSDYDGDGLDETRPEKKKRQQKLQVDYYKTIQDQMCGHIPFEMKEENNPNYLNRVRPDKNKNFPDFCFDCKELF